jgi:uncharacterized protein with HEPN domain
MTRPLRDLELIGEAATHIPADVRQVYQHVPWRLIIATRNRLIHAYLGIDNDTLWSIVATDLPSLLPMLRKRFGQVEEGDRGIGGADRLRFH